MISPAIQQLYDEHETILGALERLHAALGSPVTVDTTNELRGLIGFFREYGDGYHHQKEEEALFPVLARANPAIASLTESLADHHALFRETLARADAALDARDREALEHTLRGYADDLLAHIGAENDELFVAADEILSDEEKESLLFRFMDADRERGEERKRSLEEHARGL